MPTVLPGLHRIRFGMVSAHLLVDADGAVLVDGGFVGGVGRIRRALRACDLDLPDLRAIVLTHGHLDHTANLHRLKQLTNAPLYAHPAEQDDIDGGYHYPGAARVGGCLQTMGRAILRYRPVAIDQPIHDGDVLPFWGGLQVVPLPSHTLGHCGYYSPQHDALFVGDLFACGRWFAHGSPAVFTSQRHLLAADFHRVAQIAPAHLVPNHYRYFDSLAIRRRFDRYYAKHYAG